MKIMVMVPTVMVAVTRMAEVMVMMTMVMMIMMGMVVKMMMLMLVMMIQAFAWTSDPSHQLKFKQKKTNRSKHKQTD